jgi:hypothetical protein
MKRLVAAGLTCLVAGLLACGDRAPPAPPTAAAAQVPPSGGLGMRVRILRGSRKGPARIDPRLADLQKQLGKLAYLRWDEVTERHLSMEENKTQFVDLPDGNHVALTVQEVRGDTVTVEVALAQRNTMSRLTVDKEKRIVHQVTGEKGGAAYFVSVRAWP